MDSRLWRKAATGATGFCQIQGELVIVIPPDLYTQDEMNLQKIELR